jgi:hemolysin III
MLRVRQEEADDRSTDPPGRVAWRYDKAEIVVDGIVHGLGVISGLAAVVVLVALAAGKLGPWELTSVLAYGGALLAMLIASALYNLWPVSPVKWVLRRFDHSAIYLLIAGTYTPFISQMRIGLESIALLVGVWLTALAGAALKLRYPGRFDRLSVVVYLAIGWSGVMAYEALTALPDSTIRLLVLGGILYTVGIVFHGWRNLRFQNAIWHAFVLAAAGCHYGALLDCMVLTQA